MEVKSEGGTAERGPFRTIQKRHGSLDGTASGRSPEQYETSGPAGWLRHRGPDRSARRTP